MTNSQAQQNLAAAQKLYAPDDSDGVAGEKFAKFGKSTGMDTTSSRLLSMESFTMCIVYPDGSILIWDPDNEVHAFNNTTQYHDFWERHIKPKLEEGL